MYDAAGRLLYETCVEYYTESASKTYVTTYLYDQSTVIGFTLTENGTDAGTYYYHRNLLGDVAEVYDENGNKVVKYAYDAWGNRTTVQGAYSLAEQFNNITYRGYYYDRETGLYCCGARYYVPKFFRWLSPDSTEYLDPTSVSGLNLYAYCGNDPVNYYDPSGHMGIALTLIIATAVGLAVGFGSAVVKQAYNCGNWNWNLNTWDWLEIGKSSLLGAAVGFAYGLGGVAGGIIKGSFHVLTIAGKTLTVSQSVGVLIGTATLTNFSAGVVGYAMHRDEKTSSSFNIIECFAAGLGQAGKGLLSFFTASMYVGVGYWNVGVGAQNSFVSTIGRSIGKFIANYVPNYILENLLS